MQGKFAKAIIGSLIAFSFSSSAFAIMSAPNGWFLEANGGSTNLSNKSYPGPGSSSSSGLGGNADVGYKFMPYFAGEISYTLYANTAIKDQFNTKAGTDKHYSYGLTGVGIWPVMDSGAEIFAKLGVARVNSHVNINNSTAANNIGLGSGSHTATGLYLGAGAQYYFTPELAVNGQWARATGNSSTGTLDLLSLGLSFIFD